MRETSGTHGAIAFTLMPDSTSSRAAALVTPMTANLLAQYTEQEGFPTRPVMEAAFTIDPPPTSSFAVLMLRSSADMQSNIPFTLTANTAS